MFLYNNKQEKLITDLNTKYIENRLFVIKRFRLLFHNIVNLPMVELENKKYKIMGK